MNPQWGIVLSRDSGDNTRVSRYQDQASNDRADRTVFKLSEVARLLRIHIQTLHYWVKTGRVNSLKRTSPGGSYLVPRAELVRLLEEADREVAGLWQRARPKVLLIDDDLGIRRFGAAAARSPRMPLNLRTASSVEEGLLKAAQFMPEVILLDSSSPRGKMRADQGLEIIKGTKLLGKVRVVALVDDPRSGAGMLRGGASAFLLKPFGLSEFRDAISGMMGGKHKGGARKPISSFRQPMNLSRRPAARPSPRTR